MLVPVIEKLIKYQRGYIERRLPEGSVARILVNIGDEVEGFAVVAEAEIKEEDSCPEKFQKKSGVIKITAGSKGKVHDLIEGKAVLIESVASYVQALLGFGQDSEGEAQIIAPSDKVLTQEMVNISHRGKILVGGSSVAAVTLAKMDALGVKGLVCGGVDYLGVKESNFPLLITEGYGRIPMNKEVFDFLSSVELRYVLLSVDRQELIIPSSPEDEKTEAFKEALQDSRGKKIPAFEELRVGDRVQVFQDKYFGLTGEVHQIFRDEVKFESELEGEACKVRFVEGQEIVVPLRNVGKLI